MESVAESKESLQRGTLKASRGCVVAVYLHSPIHTPTSLSRLPGKAADQEFPFPLSAASAYNGSTLDFPNRKQHIISPKC
jgi:hypothetical protein